MFLRYCTLKKCFSLDFIRFTGCLLILFYPSSFQSRRPWQLQEPSGMSIFGSQLEFSLSLQDGTSAKGLRTLILTQYALLWSWKWKASLGEGALLCIGSKLPSFMLAQFRQAKKSLLYTIRWGLREYLWNSEKLNEYYQSLSCVAFSGHQLNKWYKLFLTAGHFNFSRRILKCL